MIKVVFNGKDFIKKNKRGVQRYNYQILLALDKYVSKMDIEILIPNIKKQEEIDLKNIKVVRYGGKITTKFWQNIAFQYYVKKNKALGISLTPDVIPLTKNQIITIHDATIGYQKKYYKMNSILSYLKIIYLNFLSKISVKMAKHIITVSNFSKKEIIKYYKADDNKFSIIYNGWEHLKDIHINEKHLLNRYKNIISKEYFFYIGGQDKRKNIKWIYEMAKKYPDKLFIIAGPPIDKEILTSDMITFSKNLLYIGYISDEEMAFFMKHCQAFLFPSIYEGFGIPPLEALYFGAKVICSNKSCLPEIYKDYVVYFNPLNYDVDINELLKKKTNISKDIFKEYSWDKSAQILLDVIKNNSYKK